MKRTIETLATRGVITFPQIEEKSSTGGRPSTEFVFTGDKGRRDSIIVVPQLCPKFSATAFEAILMTSREIAELTGKELGHVNRDIKKMLLELGEDRSKF